jgi:hypothetical protein
MLQTDLKYPGELDDKSILLIDIRDIMSGHLKTYCKTNAIIFLGQLADLSKYDLKSKGLGQKSSQQAAHLLAKYGLKIRDGKSPIALIGRYKNLPEKDVSKLGVKRLPPRTAIIFNTITSDVRNAYNIDDNTPPVTPTPYLNDAFEKLIEGHYKQNKNGQVIVSIKLKDLFAEQVRGFVNVGERVVGTYNQLYRKGVFPLFPSTIKTLKSGDVVYEWTLEVEKAKQFLKNPDKELSRLGVAFFEFSSFLYLKPAFGVKDRYHLVNNIRRSMGFTLKPSS